MSAEMEQWAADLASMGLDPREVLAYEQTLPPAARAATVLGPPPPPPYDPLATLASNAKAAIGGLWNLGGSLVEGAANVARDPVPDVSVQLAPGSVDWRAVLALGAVALGALLVLDLAVAGGTFTRRSLSSSARVVTS